MGPHLLDAEDCIADLCATMRVRWPRNMLRPATKWPHAAALAARVKMHPTWKRLYELEGLTEWA